MNNKTLLVTVVGIGVVIGAVVNHHKSAKMPQNSSIEYPITVINRPIPASTSVNVDKTTTLVTPSPVEVTDSRPLLVKKNFTHLSVDPNRTVLLVDEVNEATVMPVINAILALQDQSSDPITLLINSPGGSVLDGNSLLTVMENSKVKVNTVCLQMCASMAFVIFEYGSTRYTLDRAILMAHQASGGAQGKVEGMLNMLTTIKRLVDKTDAYIANRSGIPYAQWKTEVASDLWIDGQDAVARNLADKLVVLELPKTFPSLEVKSKTFDTIKTIKEFK